MSDPATLPDQCDVVVIGGGMGGLMSAAVLAKSGLRVCVLEAARRPGGYLSGYDRKGFIFDTAIHWLNECGPGGMVRRMFDFLGPGAPETRPLKSIRRYKGESFDYLLTDDPDQLRTQLQNDFPDDAAGIDKFFALAKKTGERMARMGRTMRSPVSMTHFEKARFGLPMAAIGIPMLRNNGSTEARLEKLFRSPDLRRVWCTEDKFLSVLVPIGWAYTGNYQQPPAGGSQAFPQWLCEKIAEWDGTVAMRSRATEILLDGQRAVGVRVAQGKPTRPDMREIRCKHVIACSDVRTVYRDMLPAGAIPAKVMKRIDDVELYDSSFTLNIGLDRSPDELGFGEELVFLTRDGIARAEHQSHDPHKVALSVLAPSLRDPTMAPAGKGTITVHMPARIDDGDSWKTGPERRRGKEYREYKQQFADVVVDRVANAMCPNLRDHIELLEVATPFTHQRYTGNRDGSIMANKACARNIRNRVAQYRTPVENLLLGGHWAEIGGGVPGAVRAGANSALLVLQQERPAVFASLKRLLDGQVGPHEVRAPELREAVVG